MNKDQIEEILNELSDSTRKLIDDAYVCGYKDGYLECIANKYKELNREKTQTNTIQLSLTDI